MVVATSVRDGSDTTERDCAAGRHRLYVVGYLYGPRPPWLDCERPLRVLCRDCDHETRWRCDGHRASRCKPCSARYRRRVGLVASSGTMRTSGHQYLLTLTAPGYEAHRMPSGDWCPCTRTGGVDIGRWNASHSARWNRLRTALRREYPGLEFFRGVEVQGRGALHDHAMTWSPAPIDKQKIRKLAIRAGFGHSIDLAPTPAGSMRAAHYVSKYVTKASDSRGDVPWFIASGTDMDTGEVFDVLGPGRYRTWSMSRGWGMTMSAVKAEARAFVQAQQAALAEHLVEVVRSQLDAVQIDESPPPPS